MLLADVTYSADGSQQHVRKIWKETQETLDSKLVWRMRRPRNPFTFMFSNSDTDSGKNQSTQLIEHNFGAFINLLLYLLVTPINRLFILLLKDCSKTVNLLCLSFSFSIPFLFFFLFF